MKIIAVNYGTPDFESFLNFSKNISPKSEFTPYSSIESERQELAPQRIFFTHSKSQAFLCQDNNKTIGRILASVDELTTCSPKVGVFGYFDCINDTRVSHLLLEAAENWLRGQKCEECHGPVNLNIYNGYRLQIDGFNERPFLGEPRAPQYYQALIEQSGYSLLFVWRSWIVNIFYYPLFWIYVNYKFWQLRPTYQQEGYCVVDFNKNKIESEFEKIHPLIMESFKNMYLYTNVTVEEYKQYFLKLADLLDPASSMVVDAKSNIVGFCFTYPDLLQKKHERLRTLIIHTICISKEHRQKGVVYLLENQVLKKSFGRYYNYIGALVKEGKSVFDKSGAPSRRYGIFKKDLK